jgi:mRNA-degrading endonuclease RelE of RelBE toxin-antitoxin system
VYKVRVRNTDTQRGRRGGYRIIYYLRGGDDLLLVTIYSKTEQSDVSDAEVVQIIEETQGG